MSDAKFDKMIQLLEEIMKWVRLEGMQRFRTTLNELLKTDAERLVYENSNGQTSREIAEIVGVSHVTVINYWSKWIKYGIVEELRSRGGTRYKRLFSLYDLGIELPKDKTLRLKEQELKKSVDNDRSNIHKEV